VVIEIAMVVRVGLGLEAEVLWAKCTTTTSTTGATTTAQ
jgi:hypothetical protein